jgi:hypothetical protein
LGQSPHARMGSSAPEQSMVLEWRCLARLPLQFIHVFVANCVAANITYD